MKFLTFDINGWLDYKLGPDDYILDPDGKRKVQVQALGFRSCLYKHQDQWLVGAQALAAARFANSPNTTDAIDALTDAADLGNNSPLPSALWKLVEAANRATDDPIHLALIVPDNHLFGNPNVMKGVGKTSLEILYNSLYEARPQSLMRSRIELVWRSVAVLQAVLDEEELRDENREVLVVSVNNKIYWRVLKLRLWSLDELDNNQIRIERTPINVSRNYSNMGEILWIDDLLTREKKDFPVKFENLSRWTRGMEILVTNASSKTLDQFDIDADAIDHRTWPFVKGESVVWRTEAPLTVPKNYTKVSLLKKLKKLIKKFLSQQEKIPLAVIIENPIDDEMLDHIWPLHRILGDEIQIHYVSGAATTRAAAQLARVLAESNHPQSPAWLDSVPEIQLEVREKSDDYHVGSDTDWKAVIPKNEVVPAGELYSTQPDERRRITLAPGIEYVHLHFRRRGDKNAWVDYYTRHAIEPSDHVREVEPLVRVRPLSEEPRIEIIEHRINNEVEILTGPDGIKWDELTEKRPPELGSIPELYIFEASEEGWENLKPILEQIVESDRRGDDHSRRISLRDKFYECTQEQWRSRKFPLGSDGRPPRTSNGREFYRAQRLLRNATRILVRDLEYCIDRHIKLEDGFANRLHMGLTWLFTGCPKEVTNILLDAIVNPGGKASKTLHMKKNHSAWSVYSGVGRTVNSAESLRIIYDTLIGRWENKGGKQQDKFLLAAVSHPLARRFLVRQILNEEQKRFQLVKRFLSQQLDNIICEKHDRRPSGKEPSLELRYVIMGYRGLCQIRYKNPEWFPVDGRGECEAVGTYKKLIQLKDSPRFRNKDYEQKLLDLSAPYLIGNGEDPTMPSDSK